MEIVGFGINDYQGIKPKGVGKSAFERELFNFVNMVNVEQQKSEALKNAILEGKDVPMHELVLQSQKAKIALDLLIQTRNKLLEAYQKLNRMQV